VALWCQKTGKLSGSVEVSSSDPVTNICFGTNVVAVAAGGQVHILTSKFKRVCRVNAHGTTAVGLERAWVMKTTRTGVLRKTCWDDLSPDDELANTTIALTNPPATNAASQKRANRQQNLHQLLQKTAQDSEQAASFGSKEAEADIVELVIAFVVLCQGKTNKDIHESTGKTNKDTKRNDVRFKNKDENPNNRQPKQIQHSAFLTIQADRADKKGVQQQLFKQKQAPVQLHAQPVINQPPVQLRAQPVINQPSVTKTEQKKLLHNPVSPKHQAAFKQPPLPKLPRVLPCESPAEAPPLCAAAAVAAASAPPLDGNGTEAAVKVVCASVFGC
jgi:hypothetical protein